MRSKMVCSTVWHRLALLVLLVGIAGCLSMLPGTAAAESLTVAVDGTRVDFDWSAMPAASSYRLAVAPMGTDGHVDMSSLSLLPMGQSRKFTSTGLPSGMIFQALVLADTAFGPVASNPVQFMPFAGSVTFPFAGGIVMQADDPGGAGDLTVYGSDDGGQAIISRIVADDGTGELVMTFADNRLVSVTKDGVTINYSWSADGSVTSVSVAKTRGVDDSCDCECVKQAETEENEAFLQEILEGAKAAASSLLHAHKFLQAVIEKHDCDNKYLADASCPKLRRSRDIIEGYFALMSDCFKSYREEYEANKASIEARYQDCLKNPGPDPDPDPGPGSEIVLDNTCEVPAGAKHNEYFSDSQGTSSYWLDGHYVGPYKVWWKNSSGEFYLFKEKCYNAAGQLNGWEITYYENGNMQLAIPYTNDVKNGHQYDFYNDGRVYIDNTFVNGANTHRIIYYEDGSVKGVCAPGENGQLWCTWQ